MKNTHQFDLVWKYHMLNLITDQNEVTFKSDITKGGKSEIIYNDKKVEIEGAESKYSALLVVVADPTTRTILETKSFDVNLEECDPKDRCKDYRGE